MATSMRRAHKHWRCNAKCASTICAFEWMETHARNTHSSCNRRQQSLLTLCAAIDMEQHACSSRTHLLIWHRREWIDVPEQSLHHEITELCESLTKYGANMFDLLQMNTNHKKILFISCFVKKRFISSRHRVRCFRFASPFEKHMCFYTLVLRWEDFEYFWKAIYFVTRSLRVHCMQTRRARRHATGGKHPCNIEKVVLLNS